MGSLWNSVSPDGQGEKSYMNMTVKPVRKSVFTVKVPSPEAYIFHKGLVFERRRERQKKAKDLYYIFDILANCPELRERIIKGLNGFEKQYPTWFSSFIRNLQKNFADLTADGILMISGQRPAGAFPKMTEEQFKQYVLGIFQQLIEEL